MKIPAGWGLQSKSALHRGWGGGGGGNYTLQKILGGMYITEDKCKFDAADIAILNGLEQGFFLFTALS